jgi:glycine/D-amino acid oxidase-like deaminating enzyme/nitrite reductase/ring-hydroxylating ferredoxin subunit
MPSSSPLSLWIDTSPTTDHPALLGDQSADVVVVGAGIVGLTTALLLQRAGRRVVVVEADRVCTGTTGHTTAKVTALHGLVYGTLARRYDEHVAAVYARANEAALEQVEALVRELEIECDFQRTAAYTYTEEPERVADIENEVAVAARAGLAASLVTDTELPFPVRAAVRLEHQIALHGRLYCLGLAQALRHGGGTIHERSRVTDVDTRTGMHVVMTARGSVTAPHVVLATLLPFLDRGGFFAKATPQRSYLIAARLRQPVPQGMYISVEEPKRSLRSAQHGRYLLVGGEGHAVGGEPDTGLRYRRLETWARARFDVESVDYRWSGQDYMSVDGLPFIGPMPRGRGIMVATGFGKWGMSLGTLAAMILHDHILGRANPWAATFDAKRLNLRQSLPQATRAGLHAAKHFFGDRLANLRAPEASTLAPGEACIAKLDGHTVAAHRDDGGRLYTVSPVCTHMGCQVTWNVAERSWDCPCHGSRFAPDGRVIQGPALADLERIDAATDATRGAPVDEPLDETGPTRDPAGGCPPG